MDYPWYLVYLLPGMSQQNIYVMYAADCHLLTQLGLWIKACN